MAAASARELDRVKQAINSLCPNRRNPAQEFTDDQLQRLYDEGFESVDDLKVASEKSLKGMGLRHAQIGHLLSGQAEAVDDRLRHLLEADLDMLAIKVKGFLHPDTYISEAQLGRFIKNMPLFQHAAPASAMPLPPTAEQLKAFIDSLMLSQQQSGSDWVDRLGPMEWEIRRRRSHSKPSASDRYYAPSAPRSTFVYLKEEGKVHLAVGFILRGLLSAGMLKQYFRDTRRGGIMGSPHAPNFTGFVTPAEAWSSVGVVVQVRGENMERALGEIVLSTQEQFHAQPSRKRAIAVAVGRDSVDIVVATKQESGSVTYQHSTQQSMDLSSDSPGLQHLVAALTASPEASGYMSMEPAYPPSKQIEYVGPSAPLKYVVSDQPPLSTQVYQVNIKKPGSSEPEAAILKIGWSPLIDTEVKTLKKLEMRGLADNCTRVVDSGTVSKEASYVLLQPVGRHLSQQEDPETIIQLGMGLVETVERWDKAGLLHRDLSDSNVGLGPDGRVVIWDVSSMAAHTTVAGDEGLLIGTPPYVAIDVQDGAAASLSTELESIFYVLTALSSVNGMLHWQKSPPGNSDAKTTAMMNEHIYKAKVQENTRKELLPLINALHNLFFPLASKSAATPTAGRFYRTNVTAQEVKAALSAVMPISSDMDTSE